MLSQKYVYDNGIDGAKYYTKSRVGVCIVIDNLPFWSSNIVRFPISRISEKTQTLISERYTADSFCIYKTLVLLDTNHCIPIQNELYFGDMHAFYTVSDILPSDCKLC